MTDAYLRRLLAQLRTLQRRQRAERPPVDGLSRTAVRVLGAVARADGGIQPSQLARELVMTSSNVAAALRELTSRRLIKKTPDRADTRRVNLTLTRAGARLVANDRASRDIWMSHAISELLTAEEEDVLIRAGEIFERLANHHPSPPRSSAHR